MFRSSRTTIAIMNIIRITVMMSVKEGQKLSLLSPDGRFSLRSTKPSCGFMALPADESPA